MPDSSGFGSYTESGVVIPARLRGEEVNFVNQMYLDDDPLIAAGREIWGFPKKYAHPRLEIVKDTLTGTLEYVGQLVDIGTMGYERESMAGNGPLTTATLSKTQINLKLLDRAGPPAPRPARQCAGRRSAGTACGRRPSFPGRPDAACPMAAWSTTIYQAGIRLTDERRWRDASGTRSRSFRCSRTVPARFLAG